MEQYGNVECEAGMFSPASPLSPGLESYSRLNLERSRSNKMGAAESRQEVIQRDLVREVERRKP
jgi:hypothetical protein